MEADLEQSKKAREDFIADLKSTCFIFLSQVEDPQDREILRSSIHSKLGPEYAEAVLGDLVFENLPPIDGLRVSHSLPEFIPEDDEPAFLVMEAKSPINSPKNKEIDESDFDEPAPPPAYDEDEKEAKISMEEKVVELKQDIAELKSGEGGEGGEPPEEFLDPITKQIMEDPVVLLEDGNTYDRASIMTWLETHNTSPITGEVLESKEVAPNHPIKRLIEEFKAIGL